MAAPASRTRTARGVSAASPARPAGVYAYALDEIAWHDSPRPGVRDKAVRRDVDTGLYLGAVAFEPLTRSGLHQHRGTALSYFLTGALTDYQGTASAGVAGINFTGATHDAFSYGGCRLAARLVRGPDAPFVRQDLEEPIASSAWTTSTRGTSPASFAARSPSSPT